MTYNETGIDISLIVAYHKLHHQNKKQLYIVCWYIRFRRHQSLVAKIFPLFLLATAKLALSILTVEYRVLLTLIGSLLSNLTAHWTDENCQQL